MFSFNSYGEEYEGSFTKLFTDEEDTSWYINLEKIQERDGLVYYWYMTSDKEISSAVLTENDCMLSRSKNLQYFQYTEPMLKGDSITRPTEDEWTYMPPDSIGEILIIIACDLAPKSLEEREEHIKEFIDYMEPYASSSDWIPPNASASGDSWECDIGYERNNNGCKKLDVLLETAQSVYINKIASKVVNNWRYQSAKDDWTAEVYVVQDRNGNVRAVDVRNANVGNSKLAKSFMDSIERAVNKASPLPGAPDEAVFDKELYFIFSVN